jgi:sec-independent protein translocase protein TatA
MPLNIGPMEVVVVLLIALIILGPKRLPDAGRALGGGIRNFRRSLTVDTTAEESEQDGGDPPSTNPRRNPNGANRPVGPHPAGPARLSGAATTRDPAR